MWDIEVRLQTKYPSFLSVAIGNSYLPCETRASHLLLYAQVPAFLHEFILYCCELDCLRPWYIIAGRLGPRKIAISSECQKIISPKFTFLTLGMFCCIASHRMAACYCCVVFKKWVRDVARKYFLVQARSFEFWIDVDGRFESFSYDYDNSVLMWVYTCKVVNRTEPFMRIEVRETYLTEFKTNVTGFDFWKTGIRLLRGRGLRSACKS